MAFLAARKQGFFFSPTIDLGSEKIESAGNSSLYKTWGKSNGNGVEVLLKRLDKVLEDDKNNSLIGNERKTLLWLDVEGSALDALWGMPKTLKCIVAAKIEIEYGKQPGQWEKKSIFRVMYFMARNGFVSYSGYLHPVTRGDMFFIHSSKANFLIFFRSLKYSLLVLFAFGFVYPLKIEFLKIMNISNNLHGEKPITSRVFRRQ